MGVQKTVQVINETIGTHLYLKRKLPLDSRVLNHSPSIRRRLVLSRLLLVVGERRLLVACGAAAGVRSRRVWSGLVVGWVSVVLVKLSDALAIPSIRKVEEESPGHDREEGEGNDSAGGITEHNIRRRFGPLVGQDAKADEPQKRPSR